MRDGRPGPAAADHPRPAVPNEFGRRLLADASLAVSEVQQAIGQLGLRTDDPMTTLLIQRAHERASELKLLLESLGEELAATKAS